MNKKKQSNFRLSSVTTSQLEWLMERWGVSKTEVLARTVAQIYREETARERLHTLQPLNADVLLRSRS